MERAGSLIRARTVPIVRRQAEAAADPRKGVNLRYDELESRLQQQYVSGKISADAYSASLTELTKRRERDLDALKKTGNEAAKTARAADKLRERGEDAAKRIANITDRFLDIPAQRAAIDRAKRELDDLATDFLLKQPKNAAAINTARQRAYGVIDASADKPLRDQLEVMEGQAAVQKLIAKGRDDEAEALRIALVLSKQQDPLNQKQIQQILEKVRAQRELDREVERTQRRQQAYLNAVQDVRSTISGGIAGAITGRGGNFFQGLEDTFANLFAERLTENLFGPLFDRLADQITNSKSPIEVATGRVATALDLLVDTIQERTDRLGGASALQREPANDNPSSLPGDIVVTGKRFSIFDVFDSAMQRLESVIQRMLETIGQSLKQVAQNAGTGMLAGQLILGGNNSKVGSAIGGAIGGAAGKALGAAIGGPVGAKIGEVAGSILGGLTGGLFGSNKRPQGAAVVTSVNTPASVTGNNDQQKQAVSGLSLTLQSGLNRIIDQLGGAAGSFAVSIGKREDYYRVSRSGSDAVGNKTYPSRMGSDVLYDGQDANEALRIAILDAIQDGAVQGIREGSKRLLAAGQDLDANLNKALRFEQVFKDLKRYTDPAGAALDELNVKFRQLKDIFTAAGASAAEFKDLEDLYGRERADALKQASEQFTSSLKNFLSSLTTGDTGLSLRTRLANAQAEYNPLASRVAAGDQTAYDAYTQAAQTLLDIQRQIYGSGEEYFASLAQITNLTKGALGREQSKYDQSAGSSSPFDTQPIVSATETQTQALIGALKPALDQIAANTNMRVNPYAPLGKAANF